MRILKCSTLLETPKPPAHRYTDVDIQTTAPEGIYRVVGAPSERANHMRLIVINSPERVVLFTDGFVLEKAGGIFHHRAFEKMDAELCLEIKEKS